MSIRYIEPLSRAVDRATGICFRPFDLGKWFVLGFACWLARLGQGGSGGVSFPVPPFGDRDAEGSWVLTPLAAIEPPELLAGGFLVGLIGCLVLAIVVLIPLFLWLSSRGEFIFLDGVVHDRALIAEPWKEYKAEGNSLFLWRLGFIGVAILIVLVAVSPAILFAVRYGDSDPPIATLFLLLIPVFLVAVGLAYVGFFLRSFVVPIMFHERLRAMAAWRRFGPYLRQHLAHFVLFGLWVLALWMGTALGLLVLVIATCCLAGIVMVIPYLGTVLLLPIYVAFRALSLEYLAQFTDDWRILPQGGPATESAGELPPPAPGLEPPPFEPEL